MRRKNSPQQLDLFKVTGSPSVPESDVLHADISLDLQKLRDARQRNEQAVRMWHLFSGTRRARAEA